MATFEIIDGSLNWADRCREFCRVAYMAAYTRPELGITADLFSEEVFSSNRIQQYYRDLCTTDENHHVWLAVDERSQLLGMVAAARTAELCEMKSLYVHPDHKKEGIGSALFAQVVQFAGNLPIELDVVHYMSETIDLYKHWGFEVDESKGKLIYPIQEWPESARQAFSAVYMTRPGKS